MAASSPLDDDVEERFAASFEAISSLASVETASLQAATPFHVLLVSPDDLAVESKFIG